MIRCLRLQNFCGRQLSFNHLVFFEIRFIPETANQMYMSSVARPVDLLICRAGRVPAGRLPRCMWEPHHFTPPFLLLSAERLRFILLSQLGVRNSGEPPIDTRRPWDLAQFGYAICFTYDRLTLTQRGRCDDSNNPYNAIAPDAVPHFHCWRVY